jgi:hypothetical protein
LRKILLLGFVLLTGCASPSNYVPDLPFQPVLAYKQEFDKWVGQSADALFLTWGRPTQAFSLLEGNSSAFEYRYSDGFARFTVDSRGVVTSWACEQSGCTAVFSKNN